LAALEHDLGWDPRTADVIVGTSAGAITGALLRAGVPAADLAGWTVQGPLSTEGRILIELFGNEFPELAPLRLARFLRPPRLPSKALLRRLLPGPGRLGSASTLITLLAPGKWDVREHLAPFRELGRRGWPPDDLWICAVRQGDGQRVIFGSPDGPEAPLHLAVAASCAVPGYFAPVTINGIP
jgi:NTE family protein